MDVSSTVNVFMAANLSHFFTFDEVPQPRHVLQDDVIFHACVVEEFRAFSIFLECSIKWFMSNTQIRLLSRISYRAEINCTLYVYLFIEAFNINL